MADKVGPRPLPEPIDDEGLVRWKVQFQYRVGIVLDHILLDQFGAILARIERAEGDRDEARRMYCEDRASLLTECAEDTTPRAVCMEKWPDQADRLFPPEVPR